MSNSNISVNLSTPYKELILFDKARYAGFSKETVEKYRDAFKNSDITKDDLLDAFELTKLFEGLGETKTRLEVKGLLNSVDGDQDGKITFSELLDLIMGPEKLAEHAKARTITVTEKAVPEPTVKAKGTLAEKAAFFQSSMNNAAQSSNAVNENKERLTKEAEERRRLANLKKEQEDAAAAEIEAKKRAADESKSRLQAKMAAFQQ